MGLVVCDYNIHAADQHKEKWNFGINFNIKSKLYLNGVPFIFLAMLLISISTLLLEMNMQSKFFRKRKMKKGKLFLREENEKRKWER